MGFRCATILSQLVKGVSTALRSFKWETSGVFNMVITRAAKLASFHVLLKLKDFPKSLVLLSFYILDDNNSILILIL